MKRIRKITRHTLKFFIIPLFALFFLSVGTASALFYFYPKQKVLAIVTDAAEQTLKRKVTAADIRYNLGGVRVSGVTVLNSMNPDDSALIKVGSIDVDFSISSFLKNKIEITALVIRDMDLSLSYKNDTWNIKSLIDDISSSAKQIPKKKKSSNSSSTALKKIRLEHASVTLESAPAVIRPLIGKYLFTGTVDIEKKGSIRVLDFALTLPEGRGTIESESVEASPLDETFSITGNAKLRSAAMGWLYRWGEIDLPYSIVSGTITDLKITKDILGGTLDGRSHLSNKAELKAQGSFIAHFRPFALSITDTRIHTGSSTARVRAIHVAAGAAPRFAVDQVDAQVEQIAPLIPGFPSKLYGHVSGDLSSDGSLFSGKLSLDNVGFDRESKLLSALSGEVTVSKNIFRAENLPVKVLSNDATVSVAAPENLLKEVTVNLRAPLLNFSESKNGTSEKHAASSQSDSKTSNPTAALLIPIRVRGNLDIGQIRKDTLIISKLECAYDFSGKTLSLPRFRCAFLDSTVTGSGTVDLAGSSPAVEAKLSVDDLKVQNLSIFKEEIKGRLFGSARAKAALSLKPLDDDIVSSIKGSCDFSITNGKVANTGIQNALGIWLDPLKYKLKDLEFNTISGSVKMDQGNFDIRTLIFNSPEIRLLVDGTIAKKTDLNSRIALEFTNTFIQDLPNPALLRLNQYKKGKWYTIHIAAKGNIPEAKYDVSETP